MLAPGLHAVAALQTTSKAPAKKLLRRAPASSLLTQEEQQLQQSSSAKVYKGLRNTGNTCFFNSTLQSISALSAFQRFLYELVQQAELSDTPTPAIDALLELVHHLSTPAQRHTTINPTNLVHALQSLPSSSLRSLVGAHQQQDAHELFALLNEAVDAEAKAVRIDRHRALDTTQAGLRALMAPSLPWPGPSHISAAPDLLQKIAQPPTAAYLPPPRAHPDPLPPTSPFEALLAQRTTCLDCGYCEAIRHFTTSEISLSVPSLSISTRTSQITGTSACSLPECLALWSELEQVDWVCWNCSLRQTLATLRSDVTPKTNGASQAVSPAKKKRMAQVRSKESKVVRIIESGLSEDEIRAESADPTSPLANVLTGVTLVKSISRLATKQIMVSRPPRILTLHLNRSSYSATAWAPSKNNRHVLFDEILDLGPITLQGSISTDGRTSMNYATATNGYTNGSSGAATYRLAAIVVHYGSHSFGHYIAYKRVQADNSWLRISDENVTRVDWQQVRGENPYMLFYELLDSHPGSVVTKVEDATVQRARPRTTHRWHPPTSPSP